MKKAVIFSAAAVMFFSAASYGAVKISDSFIFSSQECWGNYTDADILLPAGLGLKGSFGFFNSFGGGSSLYSAGFAKGFLFQSASLDINYNGNRSRNYNSDEGEIIAAFSPFMMLSALFDLQAEVGYGYTMHTLPGMNYSTSSQSFRLGLGTSIMQTTGVAAVYTLHYYSSDLSRFQEQVVFYPRLSAVLSVVSDLPDATLDVSIFHIIFDSFTPYFNYSLSRYVISESFVHSFLFGADYYFLPNWSAGLAYNFSSAASPGFPPSCSLNTGIRF